ncbi:MAG: pseudouridine synthase, partial [Pseudomonadota bacterium]
VLLFALDAETVRAVTAQFESREVEKHYLAVVRGHIAEVGVIDHPLRDIAGTSDAAVSEARREAVTAFERVDAVELPVAVDRYPTSRYSLVRLRPRTGRQHQLRRHMHHVSHPIIGDTRYGKGVHNRFFREHFGCHRLLLACTRLELEHPVSGERLRLEAAPSGEFEALLAAMGWGGERSGR